MNTNVSLWILLGALLFGGCASSSTVRHSTLFGMKFSAEYKGGVPYRGSIPEQGAPDYFWVTDFEHGRPTQIRHYLVKEGKPELWLVAPMNEK